MRRIVSGGQTGVDRAALDAARSLGIETGGWVPRGRAAEDGPIPHAYAGLVETASDDVAVRTAANVRDSDGTLIVATPPLGGGTAWTAEVARDAERPLLVVPVADATGAAGAEALAAWLAAHAIAVLNVAGPRASEDAAAGDAARQLLLAVLGGDARDALVKKRARAGSRPADG